MTQHCPTCHSEVAAEASFCSKCGERLAQPRAAQPSKARGGVYAALFAVAVVAIIAVVVAVFSLQSGRSSLTGVPAAASRSAPKTHTTVLLKGDDNVVDPGQVKYWTFKVEPDTQNARVQGKFEANGGAGKDIRVMLLTAGQFVQWRNRELNFLKVYDSGLAHASLVDVRLQEPGTYHLVLDNTFSVMSAKNVSGDITLMYER
jgi:hypothetical protein